MSCGSTPTSSCDCVLWTYTEPTWRERERGGGWIYFNKRTEAGYFNKSIIAFFLYPLLYDTIIDIHWYLSIPTYTQYNRHRSNKTLNLVKMGGG